MTYTEWVKRANTTSLRYHASGNIMKRHYAAYERYQLACALEGSIARRNGFCAKFTQKPYTKWAGMRYGGNGAISIASNPIFGGIVGFSPRKIEGTCERGGDIKVEWYTHESESGYTEVRALVLAPENWRGSEEEKRIWEEILEGELEGEIDLLRGMYLNQGEKMILPPFVTF